MCFANIDIFELAFNFQYTDCQIILNYIYRLLALKDIRENFLITLSYYITIQIKAY